MPRFVLSPQPEALSANNAKRKERAMIAYQNNPAAFDALVQEVSAFLHTMPDYKDDAGYLGKILSADARQLLRRHSLRLVPVLQCFPDQFQLTTSGPRVWYVTCLS